MKLHQRMIMAITGFSLLNSAINAQQVDWNPYGASTLNASGKKLLYFQIPGSTLDLEFEENVLQDSHIQKTIHQNYTPIRLSSNNADDFPVFKKYAVHSSPTLIVMESGNVERTLSREYNREIILAFLEGKEIPKPQNQGAAPSASGTSASQVYSITDSANHPANPDFDITGLIVSQQENILSTTLKVAGVIDSAAVARYMYFIDADGISTTGYSAGEIVGAEYFVQSDIFYQHSGEQTAWNWSPVGTAPYSFSNAEFYHTLTIPGLKAKPKGFWAMTQDSNWQTIDLVSLATASSTSPNNNLISADSNTANSSLVESTNQPPTQSEISSPVSRQQYFKDPEDGTGGAAYDLTDLHVAIVGDYLRVSLKLKEPLTAGTVQIFLDVDQNSRTGFATSDKAGAEFMVEGLKLNQFKGASNDEWKWEAVADLKQTPIANGITYEIPRSRAGIKADAPFSFWVFISNDQWQTVDAFPNEGVAIFEGKGN
ncbi:MAG: hypothetical protein ACFCU1_11335 [Sumerlaeia bacterium]